jgi:hypothetical protein
MKQDNMLNLEGMTFYLLLVNKGDSSVTVSDLWFGFDIGVPGCAMNQTASKKDEDDFITPIFLPPKQASEIMPRFKIKNLPKWEPIYCLARDVIFTPEGQDPPKEPLSPPPPVVVEEMSITLEFTTVGTNYGVKKMKISLATVYLGNSASGKVNSFRTDTFHALLPIREDPPLFAPVWNFFFEIFQTLRNWLPFAVMY